MQAPDEEEGEAGLRLGVKGQKLDALRFVKRCLWLLDLPLFTCKESRNQKYYTSIATSESELTFTNYKVRRTWHKVIQYSYRHLIIRI